jgi:hypothetical protein
MPLFKSQQSVGQPVAMKSREPRYNCVAFVSVNGFEGEAILNNINTGGYRMESRTYASLVPGDHHTMRIRPDDNSGIKSFEVQVEVRWIKSTETRFSAGFLIIQRPADRSFEKYIDYIRPQA